MGIDTQKGSRFFRRKNRSIYHVEKHQGIPMDFHYLDSTSGVEFDVRDLPEKYRAGIESPILDGDRAAHRAAITAALDASHDFASSR